MVENSAKSPLSALSELYLFPPSLTPKQSMAIKASKTAKKGPKQATQVNNTTINAHTYFICPKTR
jgi:hypothetical protein